MSSPIETSPAPTVRDKDYLRAFFGSTWPLGSLMVLVVVAAFLGSAGGEVLDRVVITALINLILVVGLYIFAGNSGVFSFGHMSFAAIGAYTAGIFTIPADQKEVLLSQLPDFLSTVSVHPIFATLIGGGIAAVFAAIISLPLMRMSGIGASLATFAVLIIVFVVASNWQQITNGTSGMAGVPNTTGMHDALVWGLIAMLFAYLFQSTRWGLRLRGSREDEVAARAAGVGVSAPSSRARAARSTASSSAPSTRAPSTPCTPSRSSPCS
jgi:branched-chain amino acid transport system permease protein